MLELLQFSFLYIKKVVAYCYIHFEYETKNKVSTNDTLNDTIRLTKNEQEILNLIVNNKQITREEIVNKTKQNFQIELYQEQLSICKMKKLF